MENKKEIFADGIGQIHFAGGMVRYDFVTLQPEAEGKIIMVFGNLRAIMTATAALYICIIGRHQLTV